jgi:hypothetical protein
VAFAAHYVVSLAAAARNVWLHAPARAVVLRTVQAASRPAAGGAAGGAAGSAAGGAAGGAAGAAETVPAVPATGEPSAAASRLLAAVGAVPAVPAVPASLRVREEALGTLIKPQPQPS